MVLNLSTKTLLCVLLLSLSVTLVYAHGEEEATGSTETASVVAVTQYDTPLWSALASLGLAAVVTGVLWTFASQRFTSMQLVIIALLVSTSTIHLILGLLGDNLLLFNGVGYLGLVALRFLPFLSDRKLHLLLNGVIIIYAIVTIIGYFVVHGAVDTVGLITKMIEGLLILAVAFDVAQLVRQSSESQAVVNA